MIADLLNKAWILTVLCAGVGFLIAVYMTLGYYRLEPFFSTLGRIMPPSCRMDEGECISVLEHPAAHVLGLPNALYGAVYYLVVIVAIAARSTLLLYWCRWASVLTLVMSAFLVYVLARKMKRRCVLCFTGHLMNAMLAVLLWNLPDFDIAARLVS